VSELNDMCFDPRVCIICTGPPVDYEERRLDRALARAAALLGWTRGADAFGTLIRPEDRVLIKPNLVMDRNQGPWGLEPLLTQPSLIFTAARQILRSNPSRVLVGDAPLQSCDFEALTRESGLTNYSEELQASDNRFRGIGDFRRTTCDFIAGVRVPEENRRPMDQFVLFNLQAESLLEEITDRRHPFRVTCYDPNLMARTHSAGQHEYLVAREVVESDLVVNMPKLKTHRKAGMTCALKNLIGINGNKEYLPHHRLGGFNSGGDCYPGNSKIKRALEHTLDRANSASSFGTAFLWRQAAAQLTRAISAGGDQLGVEGAWSGNDTIWRTCLDLNRILLYGRQDGTLADGPQRRVIHIVDAIVAGQGEGPLRPQPLQLGLIVAGYNAAAVDWISAQLLSFDPDRLPVVRNAFDRFRWPLTEFQPEDVVLLGDLGTSIESIAEFRKDFQIVYPAGWLDATVGMERGSQSGRELF
jgi:uncharacterized protein (DUF362 family)